MQAITFYNDEAQRLAGNLYLPSNDTQTCQLPAIVLCQGLSGVKHKVLPNVAKQFTKHGYVTLAFDYRGCGDSAGDPQNLKPLERVEDARHAIAWIKQHPKVAADKIYLYGLSYGAATCLAVAALDDSIKAVAAVSGAVDGIDFMQGIRNSEQWLNFKSKLAEALAIRSQTGQEALIDLKTLVPFPNSFWEKYKTLDSKLDSESIPEQKNTSATKQPQFTAASAVAMLEFKLVSYLENLTAATCIIHGAKDDAILIESARKTYLAIGAEKEIHIIPNSDHIDLDHGPGLKQQVDLALNWFAQHK